ncbi:hypothetical protein cyc_03442 [Cyclospora cayetanensis]|uniref:Cleavage and polyadenylation specificity factor subunit 2 n=1 Tax=Cyclospora cayetanensis TaxID=88456 RepID=A0A1D3CXA2_9EIME|nr:hypothetical protein cyc_03442 [Cyclospora cayetanensis]
MESLRVEHLYSGDYCAALVTINETKLLLNCGIPDTLDPSRISLLLRQLDEIDAVLLSHGTVSYCGALPLLHKVRWRSCSENVQVLQRTDSDPAAAEDLPSVYCTHAAQHFGKIATEASLLAATDCFAMPHLPDGSASAHSAVNPRAAVSNSAVAGATTAAESSQSSGLPFTAADVAAAFGACIPIRYHEAIPIRRRRRAGGCCSCNDNGQLCGSRGRAAPSKSNQAISASPSCSCMQQPDSGVYVQCIRAGLHIGGAVWIVESSGLRVVLAVGHAVCPLWCVLHTLVLPLADIWCSLSAGVSVPCE